MVFCSSIVFNEKEYLEVMSLPSTWMGVPELKLFADLLDRMLIVITPREGAKLSSGIYNDVYLPRKGSFHLPPLLIKSTPNHFQVNLMLYQVINLSCTKGR